MEALTARCAESVALLHLLHHVPVQPQSNSLNRVPPYKEGYTLSFEQERRLSGVLAFLSSIRNDPNYIPAVCLRERRKPSCLEVLIAVNKGDKDDGNNTLTELLRGFNKLFAVLSRVCEGKPHVRLPRMHGLLTGPSRCCTHWTRGACGNRLHVLL